MLNYFPKFKTLTRRILLLTVFCLEILNLIVYQFHPYVLLSSEFGVIKKPSVEILSSSVVKCY